jgi:hypothetical protein
MRPGTTSPINEVSVHQSNEKWPEREQDKNNIDENLEL